MRIKTILSAAAFILFTSVNANNNFSLKTVVIDAGHGGKDPGAIGATKTNEKDIALVVALKLGDYISRNFPDVNVIYTRKTDVFLELHERAEVANKNKADLFIAVHCNSSTNTEAFGTSTYVLGLHRTEANLEVAKRENAVIMLEEDRDKNYEFDPNSPEGHIIMSMKQNAFLDQSIDFASKIENQLENYAKRKSLGVKQAGFYVLYKTAMPSLLAEIGFISNPDEERFLNSVKGQDYIASSLFNAFKDYKREMEGSGGEAITVEPVVEPKPVKPVEAKVEETVKKTDTAPVRTETKTEARTEIKAETKTEPVKPVVAENNADQNFTTIKSGKSIRKPIENSSGGGRGGSAVAAKNDGVTPIYVTASNLNPFDTTSMSNIGKTKPETKKPVAETKTETKADVKTEPKEEVRADTKKPIAETKTETKTEVKKTEPVKAAETKPVVAETKTESNKSALVPSHRTESGNVFKVQLFALKGELKDYDKISKLFTELSAEELPTGFTRYYGGNFKSYAEAKKKLDSAKAAGYSAAYLVGFKDGTRMSTDQLKAFE